MASLVARCDPLPELLSHQSLEEKLTFCVTVKEEGIKHNSSLTATDEHPVWPQANTAVLSEPSHQAITVSLYYRPWDLMNVCACMQTHSLYGNISGPLSGPLSGVSAGLHSPNASWRTLPDPEYPPYPSNKKLHSGKDINSTTTSSKKLLLPPTDPNLAHMKPESTVRTAGAAGRGLTSAVSSSSGSMGGVGVEPTVMGQDPTVMESLAAAEGPSIGEIQDEIQVLVPGAEGTTGSCALLNASSFFLPNKQYPNVADDGSHVSQLQTVESENAVRAAHAARVAHTSSGASTSSPAHLSGPSGSFAFLVPALEGPNVLRSGSHISTAHSSRAHSSSAGNSSLDPATSPAVTPLMPGEQGNQSPRDASFHSAEEAVSYTHLTLPTNREV